ncbi:MAG TPA: energy transducer TonB [Pseudomonadales bacterium]|nr:energy transducer TonB [Pseudomonadales bacterium]HMW82502.1 energy transducer TonB [Pseudomonadales bacterium]HMY96426.1 energy transducer TonB [Pseudomonadales bacterium]HMZ70724.1 energy transducer TonB [Pseudomonadales bacterium]HNB83203.1 energy transducer TonB [Pseudomonadales bacterium]
MALRDEPAPAPVTPVAEPAVAAVDPAPPSVATPPPAAAPLSADAEPPELSVHCPRRPPPQYPMAARRLGEEGVVELLVALSADGSVRQVSVSRPSGFGRLDQAAVAAVRLWQCDPIRVAGVPAAATARQRIHFSLR